MAAQTVEDVETYASQEMPRQLTRAVLHIYILGMPSEVPTPESRLKKTHPEGFGTVIAQTHRAISVSYPVEDFMGDIAYKVVRVIDGDTVKIDYNGKATNVRLIGVDTPETVHPNKPVEAYGKEASNFTKNLLRGESVYLRFDIDKTDKYGRALAYLYHALDRLFVNLEIVRQGYGHAYTQFPYIGGANADYLPEGVFALSSTVLNGAIHIAATSVIGAAKIDLC